MKRKYKKLLIVGIVAIAVIIVAVLSIAYMRGGIVKPDNGNYESYDPEDEQEPNEPKEWVQRLGYGYGPWPTPMTNWDTSPRFTDPTFVDAEVFRVDWDIDGTLDSSFSLKVYRVGILGRVFGEVIVEGKIHDEGTIVIDDVTDYDFAPKYYYLEIIYNEIYQYSFWIMAYQ